MAKAHRKNAHSHYRPARYKKPEVDPVVRQAAVTISFMTAREISDKSHVSYSAARNLINGKTKRPQNLTIDGLLHAAGFDRKIVKRED
jgi:hypothetical protein